MNNRSIHFFQPTAQPQPLYCLVSVFGNRLYFPLSSLLLALGRGRAFPYLPMPADRLGVIRKVCDAARAGGFHQAGTLARRLTKGIKETPLNVRFLDEAANAAGVCAVVAAFDVPELIPGPPPELPRTIAAPLLWVSVEAEATPTARTVH